MRHILQRILVPFLLLCAVATSAQETGIEGKWSGGSIVAPSQFSGASEARASDFLDKEVQIEGRRIVFPDQSVCSLQLPESELWRNDMNTFGSFGGDWAEIGLQQSGAGFKVTTWKVDCADQRERLVRIVSQQESNTLLLDFGRVFVVLR